MSRTTGGHPGTAAAIVCSGLHLWTVQPSLDRAQVAGAPDDTESAVALVPATARGTAVRAVLAHTTVSWNWPG